MKVRFFLSLFSLISVFSLFAQEEKSIELHVGKNLASQVLFYPQEKLYLQTDRPYYVNGEKIFFRVFLFHASVNRPLYLSRYVYVELINPENEIVLRQQIRIDKSHTFHGYLSLPEDLAEGYYYVRSYTRYMENMGEEWFFSRSVFIADPNSVKNEMETDITYLNEKELKLGIRFKDHKTKAISRPNQIKLTLLRNKEIYELKSDENNWFYQKLPLRDSDTKRGLLIEYIDGTNSFSKYIQLPRQSNIPEIHFYPEGGYLLNDVKNRIAFKSLFPDGKPAEIYGSVFNSKGELQTEFSTLHDGMGDFFLIPQINETYYAECICKDQIIKVYLPIVKCGLFVLQTSWESDSLSVCVKKSKSLLPRPLYLLITRQGVPFIFEKWNFENEIKKFDKNLFKIGISHLMLLDESLIPLSERLVFNNQYDAVVTEFQLNKEKYKPREEIKMNIHFPELQPDSVPITFAISITDDKDFLVDTTTNIMSEILLSSELKGKINNSAWYFSQDTMAMVAADLLMMTHGWRCYYIEEALQGNIKKTAKGAESSHSISGMITNRRGNSEPEGLIKVRALGYGVVGVIQANEDGFFYLDDFEYPDKTAFHLYGTNKKKKTNVEVLPDTIIYPTAALTNDYGFVELKESITDEDFFNYVTKADHKYLIEEGTRTIHLNEVKVTATRKKGEKLRFDNKTSFTSNKWLSPEDIEEVPPADYEGLLYRLSGVSVDDNNDKKIIMVGLSSASIVVNGILLNGNYDELESRYNISEIAQVEIFTDLTEKLFFGQGKPVVAFTTWPAGYQRNNETSNNEYSKTIVPLGYQVPVEFYSPRYDTPESLSDPSPDLRSTIYWKPDIFLQKTNETSVDFYSADAPTTYSVIIEGVGSNRNFIYLKQEGAIKVE
ncbi:hypothetical protein LJB98_04750 [Bacteroidales bacterium OttesenSCG-928-M11]|nr:hypothetical protein [Bacteroidales bacterium OttesenSCG-928-M11]